MKDCRTCQWNTVVFIPLLSTKDGISSRERCLQGHVRWNKFETWIIENCHAWQERKKCECEKRFGSGFWPLDVFKMICKKCGREF